MTKELLGLDDLPPQLAAQARTLAAVPNPAGGPPTSYKAPLQASGFTFAQIAPSTTWTVAHGLGRFPQVTVVDTTGRQLEADVTYVDVNLVIISGAVPFAGTAYLI